MTTTTSLLLVLAVGFVLGTLFVSFRTTRPDGTLVKVPPFRRMMFFIMRTRNESVIYWDRAVRAEKLEAWLDSLPPELGAHITHAMVAAVSVGLAENPRMNQFVSGKRLYSRKGRWITFSMKRKKLDAKAKLSAVKLEMKDGESFDELCRRINGNISFERSGKKTAADKEYELFDLLPNPVLGAAQRFLVWLDQVGLMPRFFIDGDGMYTSVFIANLGSLGLSPAYHHLYEWGNCPVFIMVGRIEDRAIVEDGKVVAARVLPLRFTFDERVDDGLTAGNGVKTAVRVLTDPARWFGMPTEDGGWSRPLWPHPPGQEPEDA